MINFPRNLTLLQNTSKQWLPIVAAANMTLKSKLHNNESINNAMLLSQKSGHK